MSTPKLLGLVAEPVLLLDVKSHLTEENTQPPP